MLSSPDLDWYFLCSPLCVLCCFILLCHGTIVSVTLFVCVIVLFVVVYCSVFFFLLCNVYLSVYVVPYNTATGYKANDS
jgi:hypothetical protein